MVRLDNIYSKLYLLYKILGGNKNSPYSLNVMVNYHYHGENRVINW